MKTVLCIAGSDPMGVAGIQGDLKALGALAHLGVHAMGAVTSITAQNTSNVFHVEPAEPAVVKAQIDAVLADAEIDAIKIGMLYNAGIVEAVAEAVAGMKRNAGSAGGPVVVLDPVISAGVGAPLSEPGIEKAMRQHLFPLVDYLTPNYDEAVLLANVCSAECAELENMCKALHSLGPKYIILKGGHLPKGGYIDGNACKDDAGNDENNEIIDYLFDGSQMHEFRAARIDKNVHGTGCAFSSLLAGYLSLGYGPSDAVQSAKEGVLLGIMHAYKIGSGYLAFNPHAIGGQMHEKFIIMQELRGALAELEAVLAPRFIPEVGMNIAYAMPRSRGIDDVAGLEERIILSRGRPRVPGYIDFGASSHVARIVLAAMSYDEKMRCAMNIRYSEENLLAAENAGLSISSFSREDEPQNNGASGLRKTVGGTMEWGTLQAIKANEGRVPDIIYDAGGIGKEPMIRLLGESPANVLAKLKRICGAIAKCRAK